jgi:hypothetical protein
MKMISDEIHTVLDYVTVGIFALAPTALGLAGAAAIISYALAVVHLSMTLVTDLPFSLAKIVPIKLHAIVEAVVGPVLVIGGLVLAVSTSRIFFVAMGVIICGVWLLSSYDSSMGRSGTKPA